MKKIFLISSFIFISIVVTSCATQNKNLKKEVQLDLIESHSQGGFKTEQYNIVTNPIELQSLYTQLNLSRKPGLPLPNVDFNNESLIAIFMGQKMSGGFSIKIDSIKRINKTRVEIKLKETNPKDMASMAITSPFVIYKVSIPNVTVNIKE